MSARVVLSLLVCLSLLLPAGAASAHAAGPGMTPTAAPAAVDDDLAGKGGTCHPDRHATDPTGEPPARTPTPSPSTPDCCPTCDCECPCPSTSKGVAIGPAHLALAAVDRPNAALATGRSAGSGAPPLRPPIGR
jgi:hypothetical protein